MFAFSLAALLAVNSSAPADLILHHGKIVTVDAKFATHEAIAIRGERILAVGSNAEVLKTQGEKTRLVDLAGKTVLPGLIDSHTHPTYAAMVEFDHPIPEMESIADVLKYIEARAKTLSPSEWIVVRQVFITQLKEQRYPSKAELDHAAPNNPVLYPTGPDASLNSLALKLSKIDKDFQVTDGGAGHAEKDPATREPTGILRNCTRYVKDQPSGRQPTEADTTERLLQLLHDYQSVGLTGIIDRNASPKAIERYHKLHAAGKLPIHLGISHRMNTLGPTET